LFEAQQLVVTSLMVCCSADDEVRERVEPGGAGEPASCTDGDADSEAGND